ncbi:MAG: hypothetical protein GX557_06070 [Chloroflexi bacterium]|nr:hypothetical protein [Chloroflexota bacterium]
MEPVADPTPRPAHARPPWLRWVGRILGVVLVALSVYYLGRSLVDGLRQVPLRDLRPQPAPLLLSFALTVVCVGLGGWSWHLVLRALGHPLMLRRCLAIQTTSNLAKYVPGYAWQLVGKGYLTRREGLPTAVVAFAVPLELGALLLSGVAVALVAMPGGLEFPGLGRMPAGAQIAGAGLAWAALALLPVVLGSLGAHPRRPRWVAPIVRPRTLWAALGVLLLSWVLFGLAFGLLARAFQPLRLADYRLAVFSLVSSFLVSLLALFVPAGLGVRESVMAATLGARLPGSLPVVVAVLSRGVLTLAELAGWGLVRLWLALTHDNASITRKG